MMKEEKSSLKNGEHESGEWKTKSKVELLLFDRVDEVHEKVYETTTELEDNEFIELLSQMLETNRLNLHRPTYQE